MGKGFTQLMETSEYMDRTNSLIIAALMCLLACNIASAQQDLYEWTSGQWVKMGETDAARPDTELTQIRNYLAQEKSSKAVSLAKKFLKRNPGHPAKEEVMYLAGKAQMDRGHYWKAYEWFQKQLANFPTGKFSPQALQREFEIADGYLGGKKRRWGPFKISAKGEAIEILFQVAEADPSSDLARQCLLRIGRHQFNEGKYDQAIQTYDQFLRLYRISGEAPHAMVQAALATYLSFYDIPYDETPLVEAQQRFSALKNLYPLAAERAQVSHYLADIADKRAHKRYTEVQYYQRVDRPGPASYYCKIVIAEYGDTAWADKARADLARLEKANKR